MAKVNAGRQGFLTKSALPVVARQRGTTTVPLNLLLNANQTTDNTSNTNVVDSSSWNQVISDIAGFPSQVQFSPFAAGVGGSIWFDGFADFLTLNNPTQLVLGTGDFTIEFWFYTPQISVTQGLYDQRTAANQITPYIYLNTSTVRFFVNGADRITSGTLLSNTWYHLAIVRISGNTIMYINGTQAGSTYADTNNYIGNTHRPNIGTIQTGSSTTNNGGFRGFISNLRVVRGIGVYTGAFTPPTSPLTSTQSAGTNIAAISGTETSLLLNGINFRVQDSSTSNVKGLAPNSFNVRPTGGQVNFHPYSGGGKYGSYWFDGSFSYIDSPDNADWVLTGDFTIEAWIYPTSLGQRRIVGQTQVGSATNTAWQLGLNSSNNLLWEVYQGSSAVNTVSSTTISANVWTHIAVTRSGTSQTLYINGVNRGTSTLSGSSNNSTYPLRIGAAALNSIPANSVPGLVSSTTVGGPDGPWGGYITGVRIVSGTAVYTGAFTPPSIQPVDVDGASSAASYPSTTNVNTSFASSQTSLLCRFDRWTLQDNDVLPTPLYLVGGATTSTTQAKFGAASLTCNPSNRLNSLVYVASNRLSFGTGNFTWQGWVWLNSLSSVQNILLTGAPGSAGNDISFSIGINTSGQLILQRIGSGTTYVLGSQAPSAWLNTWTHFAVVRNSGIITGFVNGNIGSNTNVFSGTTIGGNGAIIGSFAYEPIPIYNFFDGFIDDFNVATTAMYVVSFTPPTTQATDPYVAPNIISNSVYGAYQNY